MFVLAVVVILVVVVVLVGLGVVLDGQDAQQKEVNGRQRLNDKSFYLQRFVIQLLLKHYCTYNDHQKRTETEPPPVLPACPERLERPLIGYEGLLRWAI